MLKVVFGTKTVFARQKNRVNRDRQKNSLVYFTTFISLVKICVVIKKIIQIRK